MYPNRYLTVEDGVAFTYTRFGTNREKQMLDLIVWGAATAYQRWKTPKPQIVEGSVEDLRELKDLVDALGEDNQKLVALATAQQKQISSLKLVIFLSVILNAAIAWGIYALLK